MAFFSHRRIAFSISVFLFGSLAWGQTYVACPLVDDNRLSGGAMGNLCGDGSTDNGESFSDCAVRNWLPSLHARVQQTIRQECEVERNVRRQEAQITAIRNNVRGMEPPELEITEAEREIMFRLDNRYVPASYAGEAIGPTPWRKDSCLSDMVESFLTNAAATRCNPDAANTACGDATTAVVAAEAVMTQHSERMRAVNAAIESAMRNGENVNEAVASVAPEMTERDLLYPLREGLRLQGEQLNIVKGKNEACAAALVGIRDNGCFGIYEEFFNNEVNQGLIARNCTHAGLDRNIQAFTTFMQESDGPASILRRHSRFHIRNREKESQFATEFEQGYNILAERERVLYGRGTASVETGGE